ncbi:3'-5' exonuclease [Pectobacterium polaris]|uniref:3'-5' exonuclease n=1 Tax=Pectobacterium polaris TaxID=2042057 RepID=UPI0039C9D918
MKGLEFDHVIIPNVPHFFNKRQAQAKLFHVAILRANRSLIISSPDRFIQFPISLPLINHEVNYNYFSLISRILF